MKLVFAVLHVDQPLLEVVVQQPEGRLRRVSVTWLAKELRPIPPSDWNAMVETEIGNQDADALAREKGALLEG